MRRGRLLQVLLISIVLLLAWSLLPSVSAAVVAQVDWNFPDGTNHTQWNDPTLQGGGSGGGRGESRIASLPSPGPWGGTKVLQNYYGVVPANWQPQVGTLWMLPDGHDELWVETWVRYDSSWSIYPDNPDYPGNVDHKLIFLWVTIPGQQYYPQRWECKVGPWFKTMPCSAATHDIYYQYMKDPASNIYSPSTRLDANYDAWDNQWHQLRLYARMGSGDGKYRVWWDGKLVIDSPLLDTQSPGGWFDAIQFGGNRNQGTDWPMWFYFGPTTIWDAPPNWDSGYTPPAPSPVNGVCGSRNTTYSSSVSSWPSGSSYCQSGSPSSQPSFPSAGSSVSWSCSGSNGGSSSGTCTASRQSPSTPLPTGCPAGDGVFNFCLYDDVTMTNEVASGAISLIDFDWGVGSPDPVVGSDTFSVRYRGNFQFSQGTYQFSATSDDGVRVFVDGVLIIDAWFDQGPTTYSGSVDLSGSHEVVVEYYENSGGAVLQVDWMLISTPSCQDGATRSCGSSVGSCQVGVETCSGGLWGSCVGSVGPVSEVCDGLDNDCDGLTDEGVTNACGTCGSTPVEVCNGFDDDCDGVVDDGLTCGDPEAPLPGDVDGDGDVDMSDLSYVSLRYGSSDLSADLSGDGVVDLFDVVIVARNFGSSSPDPVPVNGVCGSNARTYESSVMSWPSSDFCSSGSVSPGSPVFPAEASSVTWSCSGSDGGDSTSCTAFREGPVGPICGDGTCSSGEDCSSCSEDCGSCSSLTFPVLHWTFDDASGSVASDSSGNGYAGSITGASWTSGYLDSALRFSGSGVVSGPDLDFPSGGFTLSAWVQTTSTTTSPITIIAKRSGQYVGDIHLGLRYGSVWSTVKDSSQAWPEATGTSTIADGQWHHVALRVDGATLQVFVDGVLEDTTSYSGSIADEPASWEVGSYAGFRAPFIGKIDDVRIYDSALSSSDIVGLAQVDGNSPVSVCGNGIVESGEACDDGNVVSGDGCSSSCQVEQATPVCGNGIIESGETCDDGNTISGDGCSSLCVIESNGPTGSTIANVYPQAPSPYCGDGIINPNGGLTKPEECDDGANNGACPSRCSAQCTLTDCSTTTPVCGNFVVEPGETCDSYWFAGSCPNPCSESCQLNNCDLSPRCGNGVPEGTEQCDLGGLNGQADSPCSTSCQIKSSPAPSSYGPAFSTGDIGARWHNYASLSAINNDPQFGASNSRLSFETLPQSGPWGNNKAIKMTYPGGNIGTQPQISVEWYLPDQTQKEFWLDTWVKFDPWYTSQPEWYSYRFEGRSPDYKTMYFWQSDAQNNWQLKTGVWGSMISTAWNANDGWTWAFDPPCLGDRWTCPTPILDARTLLYDGHWHRMRYHVRSVADGNAQVELWIDNTKVMDRQGISITNDSPFKRFTFGGNRNQGAYRDMSVYWGPAEVHFTDPGW